MTWTGPPSPRKHIAGLMAEQMADWRVVARPLNEFGDVVYDVYRGPERKAWGLKDQAAADRWVARLAAARRARDLGLEADPADAPSQVDGDTVEEFTPRRIWWND
jgi:hypothetical protein